VNTMSARNGVASIRQDAGALALHMEADNSVKLLENKTSRLKRALHVVVALAAALVLFAAGGLVGHYAIPQSGDAPKMVTMPLVKKMRSSVTHAAGSGGRMVRLPGLPGSNGTIRGAAFADYSCIMTIGTQHFYTIVDTGSSTFAIAASSEQGACSTYYSGTCSDKNVSAQYGSGSWAGKVCAGAPIKMNGLAAGSPEFAGIFSQSNFLDDCKGARGYTQIMNQGIVGMAYQDLITSGQPFKPLFDSVVSETGIQDIFSLQCCGWSGGMTAGSGTFTLGGIDHALYTGTLKYTPITQEMYYCVQLTSPDARASTVYQIFNALTNDALKDCDTIIDSGTSALALVTNPLDQSTSPFGQVLSQFSAAQQSQIQSGCVRQADLAAFPCVHLELKGGVEFDIPADKYFQPVPGSDCLEFLITPSEQPPNIIGQVMMEAYYTVFDRANKRVGFAPIAGCGGEDPTACSR